MDENYNGVIEDPRTPEEKAKDYQHDELFGEVSAPVWTEREPHHYQIFNQDGSSSCAANGTAKMLGIDEIYEGREWVDLSRRDIYVRRVNKDTGGMYLPNALEIATNHGATLENLVPSELKNESAMNLTDGITVTTDEIAKQYRSKGYIELPINIDAIADITSKGKAVLLGVRFYRDEWNYFPTVNPSGTGNMLRHGIAAVDNVLKNGKKYIVIDDSWGLAYALQGQRYLSEEFLKARCFYAGYTKNLILEENNTPKPTHTFSHWMHRGDKNADVVALQNILKYEGMFPTNTTSTGLYGAVTQSGVKKFQIKYFGTSSNKGYQAGPQTITKLNELYSN